MPNETPRQPWEQTLRDTASHLEKDLRNAVNYINDEVVPEVRRSGSTALQNAAVELRKLAERMDEYARNSKSSSPPPPKDANRS